MQRKFLILFIKYAKRGDLIHCTPDTTQKQSAWAERNFSGDSPWVINDKSSSQARSPSWHGYHYYCPVSYLCFKWFVSEEQTCCKQSPSLVSLIKYNQLYLELWRKERLSAQYLFVIMILLPEVEQNNRPINLICWSPSGLSAYIRLHWS